MKKIYSAPVIRCFELTQKQRLLNGSPDPQSIILHETSGDYVSQDEFLDE